MTIFYILVCLGVAVLVLLIAVRSASRPNYHALAASQVRDRLKSANRMHGFVNVAEPEAQHVALASEIAAAGMQ